MSERLKPFAGWVNAGVAADPTRSVWVTRAPEPLFDVPAVVTPLLPDDPKLGETWLLHGVEYVINSAPFDYGAGRIGVALLREGRGCWVPISGLERRAPLKVFEFTGGLGGWIAGLRIEAASKEELLSRISQSLKELP